MNKTIDFNKLKRTPTSADIEEAQRQLEIAIPEIIQSHLVFFETNEHPKEIDYVINHSMVRKDSFFQVPAPYPEILFMDTWLSKEISQETALKFYDLLFTIVNAD